MAGDDSASVVGALFGLDGFEVLAVGEVDERANRRTVAVPSTAVTASVASAISPVNG